MKILYIVSLLTMLMTCGKDNSTTTFQNGKSGSTARMIIVNDYMYVVDESNLKTFDISDNENPVEVDEMEVGFGIETIFPFANYLFIGSTEGMFIFDITNPASPKPASSENVQHFTACDPVVANGNYAYVTLNSLEMSCGRATSTNEMQVVNIQDIFHPFIEQTIPMSGPKGLGIDGNNLFVCDKDFGVIVFDLSNPEMPLPIDTLSGFTANDVITDNGNLLVVCDDGLRQFNYNNIDSISLTSLMDL